MAETETEMKPENTIDPSCDWVEITDPNHVLRNGIDWASLGDRDDWFVVNCVSKTVGQYNHYHKFRCLRRDHPDYQPAVALKTVCDDVMRWSEALKTEAVKPEPFPHYQPPTVRELLHAVIDEMKKPEHDEPVKQKPSLGIMPRKIWLEQRLEKLRAAISRYRGSAGVSFVPVPPIDQWRAEVEMIKRELSGAESQLQPQQPLRWQENCKPDKPGIWAVKGNARDYAHLATESDVRDEQEFSKGTWCYIGPIPVILPPVKKVVERLWVNANYEDGTGVLHWQNESDGDGIPSGAGYWIRTDRTREVER